jgi:hypothetical protein
MLRRGALLGLVALVGVACQLGGPSYLRVTVTAGDPLVDLTLIETLRVSWTVDGIPQKIDASLGELLEDGSTSFVLLMPGTVLVAGLRVEAQGRGGGVLAEAELGDVTTRSSGTLDVALALAPPPGPRPRQCAGGVAPTLGPVHQVTDAAGHSKTYDVAWKGDGWVVAASDSRFDEERKSLTDAMLSFLAPDGTKIGDDVFIDDGWCYAADVRVVSTGTRLLTAWYDCSSSPDGNNYDLVFRALDPSGVPLADTRVLTRAVDNNENWRIGNLLWVGDRAVVSGGRHVGDGPTWTLAIFFLDENGALLEEPILGPEIAIPGEPWVRLATDGAGYAMVYVEQEDETTRGRLALLTAGGHAAGTTVDLGPGDDPTVAWLGDHYVAAITDTTGETPTLRLLEVGPDGTVGAPLLVPLAVASPLALATDGSDLGAIVGVAGEPRPGLGVQRLTSWLAPEGAPVTVADGLRNPSLGAIAPGPDGFGLAWSDESTGNWEIYFTTFGCAE